MARKEINIGATGNDATGDSIRTGFDKTNQNFTELYAALGLGGGLNFETLDNTPNALTANKVLASNANGDEIIEKTLVGDGVTIDQSTNPTQIIIRNTGTEVARDTSPELGGDLDALGQFRIKRLADPINAQDAVNKQYADQTFIDVAGDVAVGQIQLQDGAGQPRIPTLLDEATNKQYVDTKVSKSGDEMTGQLILARDPIEGDSGLTAVTKNYVDSTGYISNLNIYVSSKGRTERQQLDAGIEQLKVGRSWGNAFSSVRDALFYAERVIKGDARLKSEGLLPSSHINYFPTPGRKPGPYTVGLAADGTEDTTNVLANSLLVRNRSFIQQETVAFINREVADNDNADGFSSSFTYDQEKCFRDVGLIIDAMSFDLTYVGNSRTVDAATSYWDNAGTPGNSGDDISLVAGQQSETVAAINFARDLVLNNILTNTAYVAPDATANPNAYALINSNKRFVVDETIAYINYQVANATPGSIWENFTYDENKCARDVGIILDGVAFDLKYGGNTQTRINASRYYDGAVSKVAGQEQQTAAAVAYARDLVSDYVLTNILFTSLQTAVDSSKQVRDLSNAGETAARTKVDTLMNNISSVITGGLGSLPALVGTTNNVSTDVQVVDTSITSEAPASGILTSLFAIITNAITGGLGTLPAKTGGQGREQNVPLPEITVHVESGNYEELCPMPIPENVSLKGDEFRRVLIQSKVGVRPPQRSIDMKFERGDLFNYNNSGTTPKSARFRNHYDSQYSQADSNGGLNSAGAGSVRLKNLVYYPLNGMYFEHTDGVGPSVRYYIKNITFDPLGVGDFQTADCELYSDINTTTTTTLTYSITNNTVVELKKLNQHCDVFLMNNSTIIRNLSIRRHQGFVMTLDPEGQILTKSPYAQTCSSFCGQGGGGQYVDGNSGVQYGTVVDSPNASGFSITLQGLTRPVQLPTTFLYQGNNPSDTEKGTYRIIGSTAPVDDGLGQGTFRQTLTLAADTEIKVSTRNLNNGYIDNGVEIRLETAGNKSMACNDYTQINSDGYGLVATNAGLIEAVSVFTYYCDTAYWARNGGQIRSLNGSNGYGRIGIKASGSDPNENVQSGTTFFRQLNVNKTGSPDVDYTQEVISHNPGGTNNITGNNQFEIRDFDYLPFPDSRTILSAFSTNNDTTEYTIEDVTPVSVSISGANNANDTFTATANHYFTNGSVIKLAGFDSAGMTGVDGVYYVGNASGTDFKVYTDSNLSTELDLASAGVYTGSGGTATGGGRAVLSLGQELSLGVGTVVADGEKIMLTIGKKIYVKGLLDTPRVLPSSALQFATGDAQVFRILNVERDNTDDEVGTQVDYQLQLFDLRVPSSRTANEFIRVTTKISTMRATGHDFLNIGWGNYAASNYPNNVFGEPVGRPDFSAEQANEAVEEGAGRVFYASTDQDGNFRVGRFFRVNQGDGSVELNANIGLTNVDSIGFTKGTTIDEFSTDDKMQGKSDDAVPTEATIVTHLNSNVIGRHEDGTAVTPFTANNNQQSTTSGGLLARDGYDVTLRQWNKMQGELNMNSNLITNISMVGAQADDGVNKNYADNVFRGATTDSIRNEVKTFEMLNDSTLNAGAILMNDNQIKGLMDPTEDKDAVTKSYVDRKSTLGGLSDVTITGNPSDTDIVMFTGVNPSNQFVDFHNSVNVSLDTTVDSTGGSPTFGEPLGTGSDVRFNRAGNSLNIQLASGAVKNADVSVAAAIAQSKLNLQLATAENAAPTGTQADKQARSGLSSFDDDFFTSTDGWVSLLTATSTSDGISLNKIRHQTGNTMLGTSGASAGAVVALTPAQIRALIEFNTSVEAYIDDAVLDTNGALLKSGGTMTGQMNSQNILPSANDTYNLGSGPQPSGFRFLNIYTATLHADDINGANIKSADGGTTVLTNNGDATSTFIGNSATASQWETTRNITLTGQATGTTTIDGSGDISITVTLGDAALDDQYVPVEGGTFTGNIQVDGNITTDQNNNGNIGASGTRWATVYATTFDGTATAAQYADLAENYLGDNTYEPGTVLMFGGYNEVTVCKGEMNTKIAGVVSTNPAHLMNSEMPGEFVVAVALQGRVPCKVVGKISKGDMIVSSDIDGVGIASDDPKLGAVIGKALQDYDSEEVGTIEVVVGRL